MHAFGLFQPLLSAAEGSTHLKKKKKKLGWWGGIRKNHPDLKRMGEKEEKNEINKGTEKKETKMHGKERKKIAQWFTTGC